MKSDNFSTCIVDVKKEIYLKGLKPVKFFYGKVCLTDELARQAGAEFIMLGDG